MASTPAAAEPAGLDLAVLVGTLSRPPEDRTLPSGSTVRRHELSMPLADRTETVSVSWFDPGRARPPDEGEWVLVTGRVRRRFWTTGGRTASATEVVADAVVPLTQRARAQRALAAAAAAIATAGDR